MGIFDLGFGAGCCTLLNLLALVLLAGLVGLAGLWIYRKMKSPGAGQ